MRKLLIRKMGLVSVTVEKKKMEFLRGVNLSRYLLERYSKNPNGWNFTIAPSRRADNFFDGLVSGPEESWQLKIDSIFKASPTILGAKVDLDGSAVQKLTSSFPSLPSYGYRRLDLDVILRILQSASQSSENESAGSPARSLPSPGASEIDKLLANLQPSIPMRGHSYAEGPFVFTSQNISSLSKTQSELDDKLTAEIKNLLREKYLAYG
jgi:hypothetical protein